MKWTWVSLGLGAAALGGLVSNVFAQTGSLPAKDDGPLAAVAQTVLAAGKPTTVTAGIAAALGLTAEHQAFLVKQKVVELRSDEKHFEVSQQRGPIDIVIVDRTAKEGTFFLTTVQGDLVKAIYGHRDDKGHAKLDEIPLADAQPKFLAEKTFWLKELGSVAPAASR